jgi:hypothetical protein
VPRAIELAAHGSSFSLADYLDLDDAAIGVAMHAWESARDPVLADLSRRIRARSLFKTIELFGEQAEDKGRAEAIAIARDIAGESGLDPDYYVGLDVATDTPFSDDDGTPLVIFAKGRPRRLRDVSFLLGRLSGQVLSRVRLVMAPELRERVTEALKL